MNRVDGKVAIVTGGAGGIGAACARLLIAEGAQVVVSDVRDAEGEELAHSLGERAAFLHHDVTSEAEWQQVVTRTERLFGPVSILVNNAGTIHWEPLETTPESAFRRIFEVNQLSAFLGMKSVISSMKKATAGSIVNISSNAGIVGFVNSIAYVATKFAVRGMTKTAAMELAQYNIRVNSIHPGIIETPLVAPTPETAHFFEEVTTSSLAGRLGRPEEIANMVLVLASDEIAYATGAEFVIDGGYTSV